MIVVIAARDCAMCTLSIFPLRPECVTERRSVLPAYSSDRKERQYYNAFASFAPDTQFACSRLDRFEDNIKCENENIINRINLIKISFAIIQLHKYSEIRVVNYARQYPNSIDVQTAPTKKRPTKNIVIKHVLATPILLEKNIADNQYSDTCIECEKFFLVRAISKPKK